MDDCRSLGSNYFPGSQSRKISIGVVVEEPPNLRSGACKEVADTLPDKRASCSGTKLAEEQGKGSGLMLASQGKQAQVPGKDTSPWICTRSLRQVMMTKNGNFSAKQKNKSNGITETPAGETVQFFTNQTSYFHSEDGVQKRFGSVIHGRASKKDGNADKVEAFAFAAAAAEEVHVSNKGIGEKKTANRSSEALRMKLSEILGTVASPIEEDLSCKAPEAEIKDLKLEQASNKKSAKAGRPRQNSDTIETDSVSPDQAIRRPMTRSLTRKKTQTTARPRLNDKFGTRGRTSPLYTRRREHKSTFSFDEAGMSGRFQKAIGGSSSAMMSKKNERKISRVAQRKVPISAKGNLRSEKVTHKGRSPAKKMASYSNISDSFLRSDQNNDHRHTLDKNPEEVHHSPDMKERDHQENCSSPRLRRKTNPQGDVCSLLVKKNGDGCCDVNSPTSGMETSFKTVTLTPSPQKSKTTEHEVNNSVPAERRSTEEGSHTLRTYLKLKRGSFGFDTKTESSDDTTEPQQSPIGEPLHGTNEKNSKDRPSHLSPEPDIDSSEEDSRINNGCRARGMWAPETGNVEKPPFVPHRRKRIRRNESFIINELGPSPPSQKGVDESIETIIPSDNNHEDGLARAVTLLASALERFKTKMASYTSKRSSEILTTAAEGIQLQLKNTESQIQIDTGKFTTLAKSKRRSVEAKFLEQQEQLKVIRNKFKEDINQHLQDCRSILEEMEAYQGELEGNAEKHNSLHQKLLLKAEEGIAAQLNDAERRISAVHKAAKERMFQLKHVMMECLEEGIFS